MFRVNYPDSVFASAIFWKDKSLEAVSYILCFGWLFKKKKTEEESDTPKNNFNETKLEYWYVYRVIWVCSRKKGPATTICRVVIVFKSR